MSIVKPSQTKRSGGDLIRDHGILDVQKKKSNNRSTYYFRDLFCFVFLWKGRLISSQGN